VNLLSFAEDSGVDNLHNQNDSLSDERRMLEVLNQTGAALSAELNLERLVQIVTDAGVKLVGAQFGAFFYKNTDESGQSLLLYTLAGAPREAFERFGTPRRTSLFGPTFDGQGIVRSDDITQDPRYGRNAPHRGMPEGHLPVRSYLAVPVISRSGTVLGGLFFGHSEPAVFTAAAERVIVGIAAQAAIAVDNARLLQAVQFSERRFRALIEHSSDAITVSDAQQRLLYLSPAVTKIEGHSVEALVGTNGEDHTHPDDLPQVRQTLQNAIANPGKAFPVIWRRRHKSGQWLWLEGVVTNLLNDPAVRGIVTNYRDITSRIRSEELQIRSQKMEALGTLAGGIAHDFNNILIAITGNTRLAIEDLQASHPVQECLREISKASQRAAELVRRILSFSRQQEPKKEITQLQPIVQEALNLLRATLPAIIDIKATFEHNTSSVAVDATQIHQIVMNLLTNAAHAIGDRRGLIEVGLDTSTIDETTVVDSARELRAGRYVRLSVSDNGCGMDPETLARIFDPFFTTKPIGQGTGLGLSVVHGIMKSHDGAETVYSQTGKGTTFRLYFPAMDTPESRSAAALPAASRANGERLLYVDDDDAIVFLTTRFLDRAGYCTHGVSEVSAALDYLQSNAGEIDAVITDLSMPGMGGLELARAIRAIRPELPILLTSGYFRQQDRDVARSLGIEELILKPNSIEELVHALKRSLQRCQS
jgi:PAS domain S-box-containing protein